MNSPTAVLFACALGVTGGWTTAGAQEDLRRDYWKTEFLPLTYVSTSRGWYGGGQFRVYAPVPYDWPELNAVDLTVRAIASTSGSYDLQADLHAPAWLRGWRFRATAGLERDARLAYHGIGNATTSDKPSDESDALVVRRRVLYARADVQRTVVGPVRVLAGVLVRRSEFDAISPQTKFGADLAAGIITDDDLTETVIVGRVGMIFDTRDNELDPSQGVFSEFLIGGNGDFARVTGHFRGYVSLTERIRLSGRLAGERMTGTPPFAEYQFMQISEGSFGALGGFRSHRGLSKGRFIDADKLLGSLDVRYTIVGVPSIGEVSAFVFVDAGRVFAPAEFSLTTDGLHWGGGGGLALRIGRNVLLSLSLAGGPDGARVHGGSGGSY